MSDAPQIHPTAIVDPSASVGAGSYIGPYCIVGANVALGPRCLLQGHVVLDGPSRIGADNVFYAFTSIGQRSQDLKYAGEPTHLEIGDGNTFREFATVHRGTAPNSVTRIGSRCHFLSYAHIAHDCRVGDEVVFSNNGTLGGHVECGSQVTLGGLAAAHQFCRIGRMAMIGGMSKIVQDVPPFCIADGNPARLRGLNAVGFKRRGVPAESVRALRQAYEIFFGGEWNTQQALERLREEGRDRVPEVKEMMDFIASTQRGIVRAEMD